MPSSGPMCARSRLLSMSSRAGCGPLPARLVADAQLPTATLSTAPKPVMLPARIVASLTWYSAGPATHSVPAGPAARSRPPEPRSARSPTATRRPRQPPGDRGLAAAHRPEPADRPRLRSGHLDPDRGRPQPDRMAARCPLPAARCPLQHCPIEITSTPAGRTLTVRSPFRYGFLPQGVDAAFCPDGTQLAGFISL